MPWYEALFAWAADRLLAPAIVAVVFSWLLLLRVEGHRARRDALTAQALTARSDVLALWNLCVDYWGNEPDAARDPILVEKILLAEQDLRFSASEVATQLGDELNQQTMADLVADITDAATSAPFGEDRAIDFPRLARLRMAVVVFRDRLLAARNAQLKSTKLQ